MANYNYVKTARTGGGASALDGMDGLTGGKGGAALTTGDIAFVYESGIKYEYWCNDAGGAGESDPTVIVPDTNAGTINWELHHAELILRGDLDANGHKITDASGGNVILNAADGKEVEIQHNGSEVANINTSGLELGAANARVTTILDEDDMASDSPTSLATQQSIKAYALAEIKTNTTFYCDPAGSDAAAGAVGTPWLTLDHAMDYLGNYWWDVREVTITIQMNDGTFDYTSAGYEVNLNHPCGSALSIVGETDSATTELRFDGHGGLIINRGHKIGNLDKLKITGTHGTAKGIDVSEESILICGTDIDVEDFQMGIFATTFSYILCNSAVVNNCDYGIRAQLNSLIEADSADVDECDIYGISANKNSCVVGDSATVHGTGNVGIQASLNSYISADGADVDDGGNTITTDTSPTAVTSADPTFANFGSWIYGTVT